MGKIDRERTREAVRDLVKRGYKLGMENRLHVAYSPFGSLYPDETVTLAEIFKDRKTRRIEIDEIGVGKGIVIGHRKSSRIAEVPVSLDPYEAVSAKIPSDIRITCRIEAAVGPYTGWEYAFIVKDGAYISRYRETALTGDKLESAKAARVYAEAGSANSVSMVDGPLTVEALKVLGDMVRAMARSEKLAEPVMRWEDPSLDWKHRSFHR